MPGSLNLHPVEAAQDAFKLFLSSKIPELTILEEWPYGNQQLTYPSLTIMAGKSVRTPLMPEVESITAPNNKKQVTATTIIAEYDCPFQLDLWCRNKLERVQYLNKILEQFRGVNDNDRLSLQMPKYFNAYASFEVATHEHRDDEQAAQRQERRERISLLVNLREIELRTYYAMNTIEIQLGTGTTDADTANLEVHDNP